MTQEMNGQATAFDWQKVLFSFDGRIRRSHFWIGWLICLGLGVVTGWLPLIGFVISIALIWPNLAITVKRLHDMGYTGWLAVIPIVANIVGLIFILASVGISMFTNMDRLENEDPAAVLALMAPMFGGLAILTLVNLGFLLWIGLVEGQAGTNKYGPNPKGR